MSGDFIVRMIILLAVLTVWRAVVRFDQIKQSKSKETYRSGLRALSHAPTMGVMATASLDFNEFLPDGETLFDYQQVGVAYALLTRRCFIGDEMGLGKTRQALVALEASGTLGDVRRPAVIVCPASLKGNWENEVRRCLPHRSVQVLYGRSAFETFAEIVIVNYDLLAAWAEHLTPSSLVLDESHYCKELGSEKNPVQRTKAALELATHVPASGLVLCLTGTGYLNRPAELITQLRILGKLTEVAPAPRKANPTDRDWEYAFKFTFCGPKHNGHGYEFKGSSNLGMLNERLRSSCFVRRLRSEVLGKNDTRRVVLPLSLNGALDTYRKAERDIISFVAAEKGAEAAWAAQRAEVLVALNTLRRLAGEAKTEATIEWVKNFFDSNPERSLVVFAWHKSVQQALVKNFKGCATILAGQGTDKTEAEKARFLAGETKLIVCSIQAAKEGHTLVGPNIDCHDVLFVEQGWNPGTQQQAEDRVNRIGQDAEYVFAHYLLAQGTIDEDIYELIEKKRATFKAGIDGAELPADADDESVQHEVLRRLAGRQAA